MPEQLTIVVDGQAIRVQPGTTVAAALIQAGHPCRISVSGEPRNALCGMGICFECRAVIDGIRHRRSCQTVCADGMIVETQV
jgi:predicted molibdopterin-dependent oxidoreductase YjgC